MWRKSIIVGKFFSQNKKKWEMKIAPVYYQLCKSYSSFHRKKEKPRRRSGFFLKKLFILRKIREENPIIREKR